MKIRALALTAAVLSSATAFAVTQSPADRPLTRAEVVTQLESRYPGEVIAIQFDASGDKPAHYHVDMRFPRSGLATLDVDAVTLAIASRDADPLPAGSATLDFATALVSSHLPGEVVIAQLDASDGGAPHYDVDVRLPQGAIARLKVDPATRQIAWRSPAIADE